jgi:hypothetical protein
VDYVTHYSTNVAPLLTSTSVVEFSSQLITLNAAQNQGLDSYMIKPIQRICKYPLIVAEIKRHCFENSDDYPVLESALSELQCVVEIVNASIAPTPSLNKKNMFSKSISGFQDICLSDSSQFLKEGKVSRWFSNKLTQVFWILFSDILLICRPPSSKSLRKKSEILYNIPVSRMIVDTSVSIVNRPDLHMIDLFVVGGKQMDWQELRFGLSSVEERDSWCRALQKAIDSSVQDGCKSLIRSKSQRKSSIRRPWSFLKVHRNHFLVF